MVKDGPPRRQASLIGYTRNTSNYGISGGGFGGSSVTRRRVNRKPFTSLQAKSSNGRHYQGCEASLLLPEAGREKTCEASSGTETCAEKDPYKYGRKAIIGLPFLRCNRFTDASRVANNNAPTPPTAISQSTIFVTTGQARVFLTSALCAEFCNPLQKTCEFYVPFFLAAHRAFIMADNFLRMAALIGFRPAAFFWRASAFFAAAFPFCFAHRARCAAAILARADALMVRRARPPGQGSV